MKAKPFLKWAGGKSKILHQIIQSLPNDFENRKFTYVEPFLGGGGIFFGLIPHYNNFDRIILNDINKDLINVYLVVQNNVTELIECLSHFQKEFYEISDIEEKKAYYYNKRTLFNKRSSGNVFNAALFIFLNRTCFNGLYRVNKNNEFNVPIGSYTKPEICNANNLINSSELLKRVEFYSGDYEQMFDLVKDSKAFFYLDPPYKPISKTSQFNSYSHISFNDDEQKRLKKFCDKLSENNHLWILSNSDMSEHAKYNSFFDDLYKEYQIDYINAKRYINSNAQKRGDLKELLIINNLEENINN